MDAKNMFSNPQDILRAKLREQIEQFKDVPSYHLGSDDEDE